MSLKAKEDQSIISKHYRNRRYKREKFIKKHIHNDGHIIDGFIVDRGHINGAEVHSLTDRGIIVIHNLTSGKLITKLLARPQQIKRYYENTNREKPPEYEEVLEVARLHNLLGYNHV